MFDVFLLQVSLNREVECLWFQCCQMSSSGQSRWTTGTPNSVCDYVLKWCIYCVHFISLDNTEWSSTCFYVCHILSLGDKWRAEDAIAKLNEKYGKQVLISFYIGTDDRDSNSHIIHVRVHFVFSFLFKSVFFLCVLLLFFFFSMKSLFLFILLFPIWDIPEHFGGSHFQQNTVHLNKENHFAHVATSQRLTITKSPWTNSPSVIETCGEIRSDFFILIMVTDTFFFFFVTGAVDALDFLFRMNGMIVCSSDSLYQFDQPSLGLPSRDYYVCTGPYEEVRFAFYTKAAVLCICFILNF